MVWEDELGAFPSGPHSKHGRLNTRLQVPRALPQLHIVLKTADMQGKEVRAA